MAWSCRSHSPPWSQIGQSSGWLISRNSITPSRALRTIGDLVTTCGGSPFGPGRQSRTPQAQLATGFGEPFSSTRHMRQLPAIDSRSWKQKRGISAPAASAAWSNVNSGGTSTSVPSMTILAIVSFLVRRVGQFETAFNAFHTYFQTIEATVHTGQPFVNCCNPHLEVMHIVSHSLGAL